MDLNLNAEQEAVRDAIRGVLGDRMPVATVRAVMARTPPFDDALWQTAAALGWFGLAVPDAAGGAGYGVPEAMILFVELGRALAPGPWLGTVLAAQVLGPAEGALLPAVLEGRHRVAVVDDPGDRLGDGATVAGEAAGVFDAGAADGFLVVGTSRVRHVAAGGSRLGVTERHCMDPTRRVATVAFDGVPGTRLAVAATVVRRLGAVLAAAEAVGVAERTLEASVAYAKVREQFGRPIGTFQAIKHRCADMAVRTEVARAATCYAAVAVRDGEPAPDFHAATAKALATGAALQNAADNVQNHGGMGYTWEADAHLYLKRARVLEHTFGTRATHLDALAAPWRAT